MSNYNYGLEPGIEGSGSSGVRFVLIFLVISAVTAALLWWFWPEKDGGKAETNKNPSGVEQVVIPKQTAPAETVPAGLSVKKAEKTSGAADGVRKVPLSGEGSSLPLPVEKKQSLPTADPTDPPLPAKGILTPADRKGADLPVVPADNVISDAQKKQLEQASLLLKSKKYEEAEKLALSSLENVAENSAFYRKAWNVLTQIRMKTVFHGKKAPYLLRYRIRSGDTLGGIANRFFTTVELLRKRNNISGSRIFVGRVLYIVPGDWKITVSKKFRLLKLYRKDQKGEKLFALWEIGIGRMGKTPAAEFAIAARVRNPDWYLPDGRVFKYGTPENQLGDYFLKLAPSTSPGRPLLGYGIHGASDESTVGRSLSSGCIRMRNADVELLYYLVPTGCRVSIMEE